MRNTQEMRAEVHRLPATKENEEELQQKKQSASIGLGTSPNGNNNGFNVENIHSTFQPWPSIEEVRARKEQLLKKTPLPFYKTHVHHSGPGVSPQQQPQPGPSTRYPSTIPKAAIPPHRKYEQELVGAENNCKNTIAVVFGTSN
ncbi:unnamed protein product [Cylicostephanus goldi]|uniref:Uncharacterized protein n=1 Tax=Cylicostephanus goldi TaxID=71465 RepID=A0A3P6T496_CYLGO|nr:unnamed protein product [Cylicostephanus goldi]